MLMPCWLEEPVILSSYLRCKKFRNSYFILEIMHQCNATTHDHPFFLNFLINYQYIDLLLNDYDWTYDYKHIIFKINKRSTNFPCDYYIFNLYFDKDLTLLIVSSTHSIRGRTHSTLTLPEEDTFVFGGVCASHYSFVRPAISCF